jgi:hypothetical protein
LHRGTSFLFRGAADQRAELLAGLGDSASNQPEMTANCDALD